MFRLLTILLLLVMGAISAAVASAQTNAQPLINYRPPERPTSRAAYSEAKRLYKDGVEYALAGLFSQAAELFQRAVKLDPHFADGHFALGHAYSDMGRWQKAIESFERVIQLDPKDYEAQERLEYAREMLARETAHVATPTPTPPATIQPVAEPIALSAKPAPQPVKIAETPDPETNSAPKELALTKIYRVGPGDVLDVRLNDSTTHSTLFTVTPGGLLEHPILAEPLAINGLTVEEISSNIEADLKRRALVDNPKVSVAVRDYASHTILVSGLVKDSGTKILRREAIPLYVVIADAQPLPEATSATVVRNETNELYEIDLTQAADMNLLIRPGDVINLRANTTQFLYVGGEVKTPGEKTYRRGLTLTQAIIAAGGVTRKGKEARVGRDDGNGYLVVTRFKLKDIESGKAPDPLVRPGDRIMIVD